MALGNKKKASANMKRGATMKSDKPKKKKKSGKSIKKPYKK